MSQVVADGTAPSNAHLIKKIRLIHGDIAEQSDVDAIVTAIPVHMDLTGSANSRIIQVAGKRLEEYMAAHIYQPRAGDVITVPGFDLKVKYVILAITPKWKDANDYEDRHILRAYRAAMEEAERLIISSVAFPAIGTGKRHGFPPKRAARLAVNGICERMADCIKEVRIVCNNPDVQEAFKERLGA